MKRYAITVEVYLDLIADDPETALQAVADLLDAFSWRERNVDELPITTED